MDGTGNPWFRADVGLREGRITEVGHQKGRPAVRTLEASELVLAPGFIDLHSHVRLRAAPPE